MVTSGHVPSERISDSVVSSRPRVVIVGAGFGGLKAAQRLKNAPVQVTVLDRTNHHLFQPLLYQVATATLSPGQITAPIRHVLKHQRNTTVILDEVTGVDTRNKLVHTQNQDIPYDYLILATGSHENYFKHDKWREYAPGLKTIEDARTIRHKILLAFETAERIRDPERVQELLTFVIVGAGPTGVELAGAIGEMARGVLSKEFRHIDPSMARIILVEAYPRILMTFPTSLAHRASNELQRLGVEIRSATMVTAIDEHGVVANGELIATQHVFWTAGVLASPAAEWLGVEPDKAGRVPVGSDLSVPGLDGVYVIGDTAAYMQNGRLLPGVAPVAMQEGVFVARQIAYKARLQCGETKEQLKQIPPSVFHYVDKGNLTTVGRGFALLHLGEFNLWGWPAWILWVVIHIYYLIGFENRLLVLFQWAWAYLTFRRGVRLITTIDAGRNAETATSSTP
jgi:NADH dehydrogenase